MVSLHFILWNLGHGEMGLMVNRVYYFSYCEAGFRAGVLGDHLVVARRRPNAAEGEGVPF
jgi:hypothetical protein